MAQIRRDERKAYHSVLTSACWLCGQGADLSSFCVSFAHPVGVDTLEARLNNISLSLS